MEMVLLASLVIAIHHKADSQFLEGGQLLQCLVAVKRKNDCLSCLPPPSRFNPDRNEAERMTVIHGKVSSKRTERYGQNC